MTTVPSLEEKNILTCKEKMFDERIIDGLANDWQQTINSTLFRLFRRKSDMLYLVRCQANENLLQCTSVNVYEQHRKITETFVLD